MLNAMRQGAKSGFMKFILLGFMALAVGGLVLMDVGGFFRGGTGATNVARIDGMDYPAQRFDNTARRILARQGMDISTAYQLGLMDRILENEISNVLLQKAVQDTGLLIGDKTLSTQIHTLIEPFLQDGMSKKEVLQRIAQSQNMSANEFIETLRTEISSTALRNAIALGMASESQSTAEDIFQFVNEERSVKGIFLPYDKVTDYKEPNDDVLRPFYDAGKERYAIPETRAITLAVLSDKNLKDDFSLSEEELQAAYEDNISDYTLPERRLLQQALLSTEVEAQEVSTQVKNGATLEEAVKAVTGNTEGWLGEEEFEESGLPKEFAAPVFAAEESSVVGPISTALGWHILRVKDIRDPAVRPLAEVKDELTTSLRQIKLADEMFEQAGHIDDALAGGATIEEIAEEMGLKIVKLAPLREDGSTPENKDALKDYEEDRPYILETAYEMMEGETSPVMEMADGSYMTLRLDAIVPKSYTPFEDVKAALRDLWVSDQQQVIGKQEAQAALMAILNGEKSMNDIATAHNGKIETYTLKRSAEVSPPFTAEGRSKLFDTAQNDFIVIPAEGGLMLAQITAVDLPSPSTENEEDIKAIQTSLSAEMQNETFESYIRALRQRQNVSINKRLLDIMYGPGSDTY